MAHDPDFARVYMAEKRLLLDVLVEAHPELRADAERILRDYEQAQLDKAPL